MTNATRMTPLNRGTEPSAPLFQLTMTVHPITAILDPEGETGRHPGIGGAVEHPLDKGHASIPGDQQNRRRTGSVSRALDEKRREKPLPCLLYTSPSPRD